MMSRIRRAALVLAAGALGSMVLASPASLAEVRAPTPPTASQVAQSALALPFGSRKVKVRTSDGAPGGLLEVDFTWSGRGPFSGRIFGSVHDVEQDGHCVIAFAWLDGRTPIINRTNACPAGEAQPVRYEYKKTWRALVQVCLIKPPGGARHCSAWK